MVNTHKLMDKHRALCAQAQKNEISSQDSSVIEMDTDTIVVDDSGSCEAQMNEVSLDTTDDEEDRRSAARSTYSISKSIKSMLGGQRIPKKDKLKLRHELFLRKLNISTASAEQNEHQQEEDNERLQMLEENHSSQSETRKKYLRTRLRDNIMKKNSQRNSNQPRKGSQKHRTRQLANNVSLFKELLKKKHPLLFQD